MNRSIRTRITFLYTVFAVILICIITCYAYYFATGLLKRQETFILQDSLEYLEKTISSGINSANGEFISIFDDAGFTQLYFKALSEYCDPADRIRFDNEFQSYLLNIKLRNHDIIDEIRLYSTDRNVYSSEYRFPMDFETFRKTPYYNLCMDEKNRILYLNSPDEDVFYIVRSFYYQNSESGDSLSPKVGYLSEEDEDYSILVFAIKKKYLMNIIKKEAEKRQTAVLILDTEGRSVVDAGNPDWLTDSQKKTLREEIAGHTERGFEGEFEKDRLGIHIRKMDTTGWNIVYIYDMNILYRQTGEIRKVAGILFVITVIVVFFMANFVAGTVTKPLRTLAKTMDNAIENNMTVQFHTKYNDEVAELGTNFSRLMTRISKLLADVKLAESQKHAEELKALQAQINPHFLYNTLDMVYWMAKMEKQDRIANLIADLADFFRLSLNKGEDITYVKKEIDHVRKYMEIQKVRMDGKFDFRIDVEEGLENEKVPKLILQPVVENALIHGFENIDYSGFISIRVKRNGDRICFTVKDNGKGMDSSLCDRLNRGENDVKDRDSHGYAIANVMERIKLYSGVENALHFISSPDNGTEIEIVFPVGYEEEKVSDKNDGGRG
ncbi:MAG: sensor histidine kinase [Lachnospiraceae bacterium]|nr:sensor histidine kinase [Lachnospiraceae bacterium]